MRPVAVRLAAPGAADAPPGWIVLRPSACPCCIGRVQLQVELARLLRAKRPAGIVLEVAGDDHRAGVASAMREKPLSDDLVLESEAP